jgi:hypothetical protein
MPSTTDLRTQPPIAKAELAKVERPESLRQTVISKFDACPRSFYLYCKYDGGAPAARLDRGIVFHEFVERAVRMMIDTDETSMPPEVAKDLIGSIVTERKDLVVPEYEQNALRAMAWHWANATIIDPEEVVGLEQKIELALPGGKVHGTPDFATITQFGYAQIDDYKTSLAIPSMDELENGAKSFQGRLYCLLFAFGIPEGESLPLGKGLEEFRFRTVYPRFVTDDGELVSREVIYSRDQLVDFRRTIESHLEKIEHGFATGEFPASPGSHCAECPARAECPIPETVHEIAWIDTLEEAEQALELHLTRDAVQRRLMKSVSAFHESYAQPIFVGDYSYDRRLETRRSVDWEAAEAEGRVLPEHIKKIPSTPFRKRKQTKDERDERNGTG